jgi:hypothetical protein
MSQRAGVRFAAGVLLVTAPLASTSIAGDLPKCFSADRVGHCIEVTVNGQRSTKISKRVRKALKDLGALNYRGEEIRYELASPLRGELDVRANFTPESAAYFGSAPEMEVLVVPLDGQSLDTSRMMSTDPTVRVGGGALVRSEDVVTGRTLPPGRYLFAVRMRGSSNWDRQVLYFEVAE